MGVYSRYKRDPDGFRALVELLETTPKIRRDKMIEVGMKEDPEYTERAMKYMMSFQDIVDLPDAELAEVMAKAPPKIAGYSIISLGQEVKDKFLRCSKPAIAAEMREAMEATNIGPREIGGAQLKMVGVAREQEKRGFVRIKKIPL